MNAEIEKRIRKLMKDEEVWWHCSNRKIYSTRRFIEEIGEDNMSYELKYLLLKHVKRVQKYYDLKILVPIESE